MIHTDGIQTIANAEPVPALPDGYEFKVVIDLAYGIDTKFLLIRNGRGLGYAFKNRRRAEQAATALNNAIALDYAGIA